VSLPIWIDYMHVALNKRPETERAVPDGVVRENDDWVYAEFEGSPDFKAIDVDPASLAQSPDALAPEAAGQPQPGAPTAAATPLAPGAAPHPLAQTVAPGAPVRPIAQPGMQGYPVRPVPAPGTPANPIRPLPQGGAPIAGHPAPTP
jgi:hypothetical protein